jgi:hypothetical protein
MEMMDIPAAIGWYKDSAELMKVLGKTLEPQPEGECDGELIAAQRKLVEASLKASTLASIAIGDQMLLELPLLMGQFQDLLALNEAQNLYGAEKKNTRRILAKTAPPETPESAPNGVEAEISEGNTKSSQ